MSEATVEALFAQMRKDGECFRIVRPNEDDAVAVLVQGSEQLDALKNGSAIICCSDAGELVFRQSFAENPPWKRWD